MSYCRIGSDSDVYLIRSGGRLVCHCAKGGFTCMVGEEQQMIDHLLRHRSVGDKVPHYALGRLEKELADHSFESLELDEIGLERPEDLLDEGDTGR